MHVQIGVDTRIVILCHLELGILVKLQLGYQY